MKNRIKIARAENNYSQADLAERIAVSRQTINSIETGRYIPSTLLALKIGKTFGMSVEELFQLEDDE